MDLQVPGQLCVFLALAANCVAGFAFSKTARGDSSFSSLAHLSYNIFTLFVILASAWLFYLFFSHDFSFKYVYNYSDRSLPFFYLLSAFWGGQEGTYLLWLLFNAVFGYLLIRKGGIYTNWGMVVYSLVNLFLLVMLIKVSPFAVLPGTPPDGAGLNPLLQDPWMVVHPPVMFVGYSIAAVPFSIVLAALIRNDFSEWVKRAFPWVAVTALMLAAGNILGGYWAYKTLGWGGYWGWDPVENSSLVPWLVSLALLHGLLIEHRTGALRKTNVLMTALVFLLVIYGTFLTRSGVLADFSVHSFVDLGSNTYLIGFMIGFAVLSLLLFVPRIKSLGHVPINYNPFGKEFQLFTAMILLFLFGFMVLFWSSLPMLTNLIGAAPRAADIATYNSFALPLTVVFAIFLAVSPLTTFKATILSNWQRKTALLVGAAAVVGAGLSVIQGHFDIVFAVLFTIAVVIFGLFLLRTDFRKRVLPAVSAFLVTILICYAIGIRQQLYILFFASAVACVATHLISIAQLLPNQWRAAGGRVVHFGFGIMTIGVLGSSAYSSSEKLVLPQDDKRQTYGYSVTYEGMADDIMVDKNELILAVEQGGDVDIGRPQLYYSSRMDGFMKRPYIKRTLMYDLYFSPQEVRGVEERQQGLFLPKNETVDAGDYGFMFTGFTMGEHTGDLTVTTSIIVSYGDEVDTIAPSVTMLMADDGTSSLLNEPAELTGNGDTFFVSVNRILIDEGAILIDVPGLLEDNTGETLLLDVSKKPVINLVWVGTTLLLIGSVIVHIRHRRELGTVSR